MLSQVFGIYYCQGVLLHSLLWFPILHNLLYSFSSLIAPGQSNRSHLKKLSLIQMGCLIYNLCICTMFSAVGAFFGCNQKASLQEPGICNIGSFPEFVITCLLGGVQLCVILMNVHYQWMLLFPKECAAPVSVCDQEQLRFMIIMEESVMVDIMHLKQSDLCSLFSVASCLSEFAMPMLIVFLP